MDLLNLGDVLEKSCAELKELPTLPVQRHKYSWKSREPTFHIKMKI